MFMQGFLFSCLTMAVASCIIMPCVTHNKPSNDVQRTEAIVFNTAQISSNFHCAHDLHFVPPMEGSDSAVKHLQSLVPVSD
jgi:hypothetical protein